ncbi:MoxR family ATPase [Aeromicrobium panaciterrae]
MGWPVGDALPGNIWAEAYLANDLDPGHGTMVGMRTMPFTSIDDVKAKLAAADYLASHAVATTVFLASELGKPLLVEGPAGVGKTELSRAVAEACGADLVRLQCYEGVDEARALYEWNHAKQLLRITAGREETWDEARSDIFSEEFLLARPLLTAIRNDGPTVLLIDETDKADVEIEGLLLEVLGEFQVTIPELGTIKAEHRPFIVLTSNATRELSEALRRRCLFLHIDFPDPELEQQIIRLKVPELDGTLGDSLIRVINALRTMPLRKAPSVSESIDWARTLVALGADILDDDVVRESLGVILKHQDDLDKATERLDLDEVLGAS